MRLSAFPFRQLTLAFLLFSQVAALKVHLMLLLSQRSTSIIRLLDQRQTMSLTSRYRFPVTVASSRHPGDYNYWCSVRANVSAK